MRIRVIAPTDSEVFETYLGNIFPHEFEREQLIFSWENPESMSYPVLMIPDNHEWGPGRSDVFMSTRVSLSLARELRRRHEVNDRDFARIYLGASLVVRIPGLSEIFAPRSADEMMTVFGRYPSPSCRFCLSYAIENPYDVEEPSIVMFLQDSQGRSGIKEEPDEDDEHFLACYPDDPIGTFIRFIRMDPELEDQSDTFASEFFSALEDIIAPAFSASFN